MVKVDVDLRFKATEEELKTRSNFRRRYTDKFIDKTILIDGLRLASIEEIIAMKMDVILRTGRKKDFWDIHELKDNYSISEMIALHEKRYPYTHDREILKQKFKDISCDMCSKVISLLIALHIIIALIVVGVKFYNKTQEKKVEVSNEKHK